MKDTRERAVLLQSAHHQELIREAFPDGAVGDLDGTFGENITVTGGCSRTICVGDVFSAEGSPLELQVTHPCRPCSAIDTRFGTKPGVQGARHFCLMKTSRGWFCRVLTPGPLRAEGTLRLTRRPHPEWSLARIGTLLYGSAGPAYWWKPTWSGTDAELAEAAALPELAFVHDCMPERSSAPPALARQRRRWLLGSAAQLAVSAATAQDLEGLLQREPASIPWCHSAPDPLFAHTVADPAADRLWRVLQRKAGLLPPYVLLPGTSLIGSYKNPELVAAALAAIPELQLVISGIGAEERRDELLEAFPALADRCLAVGFTELELALAYRHALAVVIPSRGVGFGLPAAEALAAGGRLIVADARGLREAAAEAGLRVPVDQPRLLEALLRLLLDQQARAWLDPVLERRRLHRLQRCSPDLIGLALLAQARRISAPQPAS